MSKGKGI